MAEKPIISRRKFIKTLAMAGSAAAIDWTGFSALAATVKDKVNYPVVVIGAGLGGLVSAAYLSKYGCLAWLPPPAVPNLYSMPSSSKTLQTSFIFPFSSCPPVLRE